MEKNLNRCVIDSVGNYITFVLLVENPSGDMIPHEYDLKQGESLIEAFPPGDMTKPRWTGVAWEESATSEEIEAAKREPQLYQPSESERIQALETAMLAMMMGGLHNV